MKASIRGACFGTACIVSGLMVSCSHREARSPTYLDEKAAVAPAGNSVAETTVKWDAAGAANYLDQRESFWVKWPGAMRDHGTFCVSCHTVIPYLISRPVLGKVLAEPGPSAQERVLLANVRRRVQIWNDAAPYYNDNEDGPNKSAQSRATESVLNAFILASSDAQGGTLSEDTRAAFASMWALQQAEGHAKGSWQWQDFDLKPWESRGAQYYGAALAAVAVATAPENYRATTEIQNNVRMLSEYLRSNSGSQSPINRVALLWASTKLPGLLTSEQKQSIIDEITAKQQSDGGWSLSSVALTWKDLDLFSLFGKWKRDDETPQEVQSDGLATGFVVFVLEEAGISSRNSQLNHGLDWLMHHQNKADGSWTAYSLNKKRDPSSNVGRFMSDAATAFAVLALSHARQFDARLH